MWIGMRRGVEDEINWEYCRVVEEKNTFTCCFSILNIEMKCIYNINCDSCFKMDYTERIMFYNIINPTLRKQ